MGIIHPNRRTALARADRWLMTGTRPSWTDGRPPACACRSSGAVPRPAGTSGLWGNAGSRARTRRCSAGSGVGGGGIERGRTASPNRSGRREARRSISAEPGPWSLAWSGSCVSRRCRSRVRTCAGWRRCRARPRNACAGVCRRCSRGRAWRPGSWCSTTPSAWATATPTARPPGPVCSPCSARYGFGPRFRDPYSGHGKGGVENAVGFRGARPDGADAVGRGLPGVGPRVARRHPRRGRRMRVRGHRQSGGDRHRRRTDHRPGRNRHMRPTRPRGQGLLGRPGSETP